METKKEEAIRKAYGEYWETYKDLVDDNGWFSNRFTGNDIPNKQLDFRTEKDDKQHPFRFRIKGLQGIENNNGWIRIESEQDLPKDSGEYWVYETNGYIGIRFYLSVPQKWGNHEMEVEEPKVIHYQHIVKPKQPIY